MRFGGIFLAVALLLGACSGDPKPKEPTDTPSSPRPTSTATLPPMPDQAKEDSPEGAAAFVTHWVEVFNYASATGDVEELSRLSDPGCKGCGYYIDLYAETYQDGGYFRDSDWSLSKLQVAPGTESTIVFAHASSNPGIFKLDKSSTSEVGNAEDSDLAFVLKKQSGSFRVASLELQAK